MHRCRETTKLGVPRAAQALAPRAGQPSRGTEADIDTVWQSIEDFTLSVATLLLPWRSTGIDLAFYY
jgi:hypothetical protein